MASSKGQLVSDLYELTELDLLHVSSPRSVDTPLALSVTWRTFRPASESLGAGLGGPGFLCSPGGWGGPCVFLLQIWDQLFFQGAQGQVYFNFESLKLRNEQLFCVSAAAAEAVVLVEGPQHRELPAPPRSAVMRCVTRDGAMSAFARLSCGTLYSTRPVSGDSPVLLHLEGPWPPSSVCLAPPTSSGPSSSPQSHAHRLPPRAGRACALGYACSRSTGRPRAPLAASVALGAAGPRPALPDLGGFTVLFTCDPSPSPHDNRVAFCTFVTKLICILFALFSK